MKAKDTSTSNSLKLVLLVIPAILIICIAIFAITTKSNIEEKETGEIYCINKIEFDSLNMNNDFYYYEKEGYKTVIGVDISEHNKEIDFYALKEQGIQFVILRIGWRGYYNPTINIDSYFEENYLKAKMAGLKIGVYFFSQAISVYEAREEANFVIENLDDKIIDFYVAYDCESINDPIARTNTLTKEQATVNANTFLYLIQEAGYQPILYTNTSWISKKYKYSLLQKYPIWYAYYSKHPLYHGDHIIWQYSNGTKINGVSGSDGVDLNLMIIKEEEAN